MRFATLFFCAAAFAGTALGQVVPPDTTRLIAVADAFVVKIDSSLAVGGNGLLSNDDIAGTDSVFAVLVTPPANGSLAIERTGAFTYTPATGFTGTDTFTYLVQTVPIQEIAINPDLSTLLLNARVSTIIGSDTDEVETPVGGTLQFFIEPNLPPYTGIHLVKMDLSLAEAVDLEFRFGGLIALGRLFVAADSGGIRLVINEPGPATGITDGDFMQSGNKVGVLGDVQLEGTGLLASQVPDDPQVFDTETDLDLSLIHI